VANLESGDETPDYVVTLAGDRVRVETRVAWVARKRKEQKEPPADVVIKQAQATFRWHKGDGVKVDDGWLVGYDAGEFGGGLYWIDEKNLSKRLISDRRTPFLAKTARGIFAIQSYSHFSFGYSQLVALDLKEGTWHTQAITDLHSNPVSIVLEGDRFILAQSKYVTTLETNGRQREIFRPTQLIGGFLIESMVRSPNGEIWIGSQNAVVCLQPRGPDNYSPYWFIAKTSRKRN